MRSAKGRWTEIARPLAGRFGFVELRTEELAQAAMQLDKVELCGRSINVGRPKGYVEPPPGARPVAALGAAQVLSNAYILLAIGSAITACRKLPS